MPRVVPSQIVEVIDSIFPWARHGTPQGVNLQQAAGLRAVLALVKEVPQELIALSGSDYSAYVLACSGIDHTLQMWAATGKAAGYLSQAGGVDPLVLLRRCVGMCPDEAPLVATAELSFVKDEQLRESIRRDISASNRDFINGEWKGATVLAGSALEALLLWSLQQMPEGSVEKAIEGVRTLGKLTRKLLPRNLIVGTSSNTSKSPDGSNTHRRVYCCSSEAVQGLPKLDPPGTRSTPRTGL